MGDSNTRRRFATFTSEATMSKCTRANAFFISYAHLQQQAAGGLYDINSLPEQTPILGFLSSPIEGLGRDGNDPKAPLTSRLQSKLHAPIIQDFLVALRVFAEELPRTSKVREALKYTDVDPSTKYFLTANPSWTGILSNTDMQTTLNATSEHPSIYALPTSTSAYPPATTSFALTCTHNLTAATRISGPSDKTRHDNIEQTIADLCKQANMEFTIEDTTLFAPARDPRSDCALPPIIPDLTISTSNNTNIYDVKGRRSRNIRI